MHCVVRRRKLRPEQADQNSPAGFVPECEYVRTSFAQPEVLDMMGGIWLGLGSVNRWRRGRLAVESKELSALEPAELRRAGGVCAFRMKIAEHDAPPYLFMCDVF